MRYPLLTHSFEWKVHSNDLIQYFKTQSRNTHIHLPLIICICKLLHYCAWDNIFFIQSRIPTIPETGYPTSHPPLYICMHVHWSRVINWLLVISIVINYMVFMTYCSHLTAEYTLSWLWNAVFVSRRVPNHDQSPMDFPVIHYLPLMLAWTKYVEQTVELPVIWYPFTPVWRQCHGDGPTDICMQSPVNITPRM